jgi:hypothetical protein
MRKFLFILLILPATGAGASAAPETEGFSRYQIILERKPFGEPPEPEKPPPPPPTAETPPWADSYRLYSVIQTEGEPIQASLWDLKNMKTVMVSLGGTAVDGIELISADIFNEVAILSKDGISATMELKESTQKPPPKKKLPRGIKPGQKKQNNPKAPATLDRAKQTKNEDRVKRVLRTRRMGTGNR